MANLFLLRLSLKKEQVAVCRERIKEKLFHRTPWARRIFHRFFHTWEELNSADEGKASMPVRLKEYLTPDAVIETVGYQRVSEALPGIFVAVGIFGTFYGLVLGLKGLNIEEVDQLQKGIGQLINGLSFAFLTSLAGILLSVIFSLIHRFSINRIEKNVFQLNQHMEGYFPYHTYERFNHRYQSLQEFMIEHLSGLSTEIAAKMSYKLGVAFGDTVKSHIVPIFKDIHAMLKENGQEMKVQQGRMFKGFDKNLEKTGTIITSHFKETQKKQAQVIESILSKYVDNLNLTFKDQLDGLKQVIQETSSLQVDTRNKIIEFNDKLQRQFESQGELIEKTARAGETLGATIASFETIADQFKNSTNYISQAAAMMEKSAEKAMKGHEILTTSIETQMQAIRTTREEMETSWKDITRNVAASVDGVKHAVGHIGDGLDTVLGQVLERFETKTAVVIDRFSGTLAQFTDHIKDMPELMAGVDKSLSSVMDAIAAQKDMVSDFRAKVSRMLMSDIRQAVDITEKLAEISDKISSSSVKHKDWFDSMLSRMNQSEESFEIRNRSVSDEFSRLTDELVTGIRESLSMLEKEGSVMKTIETFNTSLADLSQSLKGRDMDIVTPISSLDENITSLKQVLSEVSQQGSHLSMETVLNKISAIDHQLNYISTDLSESVLRVLKQIFQSSDKMAAVVHDLQTRQTTSGTKMERKGLFKRMMNR